MSYLLPKNLWGKITRKWGQCQSLDLQGQFDKGARYFDIRVRQINGGWHFVHNKVDYGNINTIDFINTLYKLSLRDTIYLRIVLDERRLPKNAYNYYKSFIAFAKMVALKSGENCIIDDCITFWDWKHIDYKTELSNKGYMPMYEFHASVMSNWIDYLRGTKWFAKKFNKLMSSDYNFKNYKSVVLMDYIEY